jgi:hypothetical protein
VPQNQRASREVLIGIANSYFDGLTTHDGSIIMAHEGCTRNENGTPTAARADNKKTRNYFEITPQAIRSPAFPDGSLFRSSAFA